MSGNSLGTRSIPGQHLPFKQQLPYKVPLTGAFQVFKKHLPNDKISIYKCIYFLQVIASWNVYILHSILTIYCLFKSGENLEIGPRSVIKNPCLYSTVIKKKDVFHIIVILEE